MSQPAPSTNLYLRLFRYAWVYKGRLIVTAVFAFVISTLFIGTVGMLKPVGDLLFHPDGLEKMRSIPLLSQGIGKPIGDWIALQMQDRKHALLLVAVTILIMGLVKNALRFVQEYLSGWVANRVVLDLTNDLYEKVQGLSVGFFSNQGTQDTVSRFVVDSQMVSDGMRGVFTRILREPLKATAALLLALLISWKLVLLAVALFPIAGIGMYRLGKSIKKRMRRILEKRSGILSTLAENFFGIKVVKVFGLEQHLSDRFRKRNEMLFEDSRQIVFLNALTSPILESMVTLIGAGVILYTGMLILDGQMGAGSFLAFYAAIAALFDPVRKLSKLNNRVQASSAAATRIFALMDQVAEVQQSPDAVPLPDLAQEICYETVSFRYPNRTEDEPLPLVLEGVELTVKRGEMIGLVGHTGAGKSTMINLLTRFYDPTSGRITIDGVDLRDARVQDLSRQLAIVTQENILWNDTVAANLRLGRLDATDEQVIAAAVDAHADEFIRALPRGYETLIGEHGVTLSGGQRQRLSIARAILKDPNILLLDEATNALDSETEALVQEALDRFMERRTTLVIAHRLSTLQRADRIVVMSAGKIEAIGTHDELMTSSQIYPSLYEKQFAKASS